MILRSFIQPNIVFFKSIDSTNNYVANSLKVGEIESGTVIMADFQTEGKGQRDKKWKSLPGESLMVSIAADLNLWGIKNVISLNHIVALGLHSFLEKRVGEVKIKWPNDIMVEGKKMVGILIENRISSHQITSIIGFGINLNQEEFEVDRATSLFIETRQKNKPIDLWEPLRKELERIIHLYLEKGEEFIFERYNELLWLKEEMTIFQQGEMSFKGKIQNSTMQGTLLVEKEDGKLQEFSNGEIKY